MFKYYFLIKNIEFFYLFILINKLKHIYTFYKFTQHWQTKKLIFFTLHVIKRSILLSMPTVPLPFKPKKKLITQKVFFKCSARTKSWKLGHTHPVGSDPNLCFISFFSFFFLICKQSFPEPCQGITRQACSRRCSFSQTDINVEQSSSLHDQSLTILWRLFTEQNILRTFPLRTCDLLYLNYDQQKQD